MNLVSQPVIRIRIAVLAAAGLTLAAGATVLAGPQRSEAAAAVFHARFMVTLEGSQTVNWSSRIRESGFCSINADSSGRETIRFRSPRPQLVIYTFDADSRRASYRLPGRPGSADLRTRARINRSARATSGPGEGGEECAGKRRAAASGATASSDCGPRQGPMTLGLETLGRPNQVMLAPTLEQRVYLDPYEDCARPPDGYPGLIRSDSNNRPLLEELPPSDLLDRGQGKLIVIGGGRRNKSSTRNYGTPGFIQGTATNRSNGTLSWELTLTRVRGR